MRCFGPAPEQLHGPSWFDLRRAAARGRLASAAGRTPAQVVLRTSQPVRNLILGLQPVPAEPSAAPPSAEPIRWLLVNAMPLGSGSPDRLGVVTTFSDITRLPPSPGEHPRLGGELPRPDRNAAAACSFKPTANMRIAYINPAVTSVTGYSLEEIADPPPGTDLIHPDDLPGLQSMSAQTLSRASRATWNSATRPRTGRTRSVTPSPSRTARTGRIVGVTTMFVDMTRQRLLEENLQRVQRLELIGRLASGIAHDFNNLLNVVLQLTALARDNLPRRPPRT